MDVIIILFLSILQLVSSSSIGEIRCYCNESGCVITGYMCKSTLGRCYYSVTSQGGVKQTVHGCVDSPKMEDKCGDKESLVESRSETERTMFMCCAEDMCNYNIGDTYYVTTKVNGSQDGGYVVRPDTSVAHVTPLGTRLGSSNRGSVDDDLNPVSERNDDRDLWFKAAVIAVPIAGGFILVLLVLLAVRMLRSDSRHHKHLLQLRRERSMTKAKLYVTDHFFCDKNSKNLKQFYNVNKSLFKNVKLGKDKNRLLDSGTMTSPMASPMTSPVMSEKTSHPVQNAQDAVVMWDDASVNADLAAVV